MQLNKIVDGKIRRLLAYDKSMNISAQDLKRVDVLSLANEPIKTIDDIANMTHLKELEISGTLIDDISPLQYTPDVEVFASYDNDLNDYSTLRQLNHLRELYLNQPLSKEDKDVIGSIKSLNILSFYVSHGNLEFLKNLDDLRCCT